MKRRYPYLRPFSHRPGAACLLPTTPYVVQAYISKIFIYEIESKRVVKEIPLESKGGPLREFTLLQDLEAGCVSCFSEAYEVHIAPDLSVTTKRRKQPIKSERLCLGVYKQQEVELLRKRRALTELFPLLFRLGNQLERGEGKEVRAVFSLLERCKNVTKPEEIAPAFEELFLAGFSSFLVPQKEDPELHNLYQQEESNAPILSLLSESARWIRGLFFASDESSLHFLPKCPPEAVYGKVFDIESPFGTLYFEWSKKQMRVAQLICTKSAVIELHLPSSIKSYRLRESKKEYKMNKDKVVEIEAGRSYFFDHFEK